MDELLKELNNLCQKIGEAYAQQTKEVELLRSQNLAAAKKEQLTQSTHLYCASKAEEQADMGAKALNGLPTPPPGTVDNAQAENFEGVNLPVGAPSFIDLPDVSAEQDRNSMQRVLSCGAFALRSSYQKSEMELARLNKVEKSSVTGSSENKFSVFHRSLQRQLSIQHVAYNKFNSLVRNPVSSLTKRNWDILGCVLLAYDVLFIPLGVFDLPSHPLLILLEMCCVIYWTSDIGMTMTTGYYANADDEKPVMELSRIFRHYVFSKHFVFDLVIVTIDWAITIIDFQTMDTEANNLSAVGLARLVRVGRILRLLKLMRVSKATGFRENLRRWFTFDVDRELLLLMLDIGKILAVAFIIAHYMVCMYYAVGKEDGSWLSREPHQSLPDKSFIDKYFISGELMSRRANTVTRATDRHSLTDSEKAFDAFIFCVSTGFITWLTSTVTSRMLEVAGRRRERNEKMHYIRNHYLVKHKIDPRVKMQLLKFMEKGYADYREAQRRTENEAELLEALPLQLAKDFRREAWNPVLTEHAFFRTFNDYEMEDICLTAVSEIFCRKRELIFKQSGVCSRMLFVFEGQYAYAMNGTFVRQGDTVDFESCDIRLSKGSWLSEPVLWTTSWQHRGSLLSIANGLFCAIGPSALESVLKHHEGALHDVVRYAAAFVDHLNMEATSRHQTLSDLSNAVMEKALHTVKQYLED